MRDVYRSLLTALAGVLALWLILGFWPLSVGSRVALSLLVILVCGAMLLASAPGFSGTSNRCPGNCG
ncbi:Uncharacterised protein [Salmonella enterica subsp. arizonae]|uniref:Uncharacterized protein n=1 Tax=Salmonella enterica subsp. arizonae TaxID=59203 RepID=A0A379T0D3_SALER|nr:Uncharacterised protein [Salmonella enterica subsp. arizonae]